MLRSQCCPGSATVCRQRNELPHRRRIEHISHGDLDTKRLPQTRRQPHRRQRVATQVEERLDHRDLWHSEHIGELLRHQYFALIRRGNELGGSGDRTRYRQRVSVEFAVAGQRPRLHDHHLIGNHVARDCQCGSSADPLPVDLCVRVGHHVADELFSATGDLDHSGSRTRNPVRGQQRGLDLAVFNAETTQLYLRVPPAQVLDIAADATSPVPGAIQPTTAPAERIGHEARRGQPRAIEITLRQLSTGDVHLTRYPFGNRPQPVVEDMNRQRRQRTTDERPVARRHQFPIQPTERHVHRRLGDAIHVHQLGGIGREAVVPAPHLLKAQCLATEHDVPQGQLRIVTAPRIDKLVERRWGL